MQRKVSQIFQTSRDVMENALQTEGADVTLCHSTGYGYDQGMAAARLLNGFSSYYHPNWV